MTTSATTETIRLDAIAYSPTNPRKTFDTEALRSLSDSIKQHGILQPVLVRPNLLVERLAKGKTKRTEYELVCGERRCRAAELAGLKEIRAEVRDLRDQEVREIQLVENLQRADVDEIEEAEGLQALIELGRTVDELAKTVGKSKGHLYGSLKLLKLPTGEAREALRSGRLSRNHAILIGRVPSEKLRLRLVQEVLHPKGYQYEEWGARPGEVLSIRDLKKLIEKDYSRELKGAPFDRQALDLVDGAGSCDACSFRAGNMPDADPGARADVCTDTECYAKKCSAHRLGEVERLKAKGIQVLPSKDAQRLFSTHSFQPDSKYVRLGDVCFEDEKNRTYNAILGKDLNGAKSAAIDCNGKVHYCAERKKVNELLKKKGIKVAKPSASRLRSASTQDFKLQRQIEDNIRKRLLQAARIQIDKLLGFITGLETESLKNTLRQLVVIQGTFDEDFIEFAGLDYSAQQGGADPSADWTGRECLRAVLMLIMDLGLNWYSLKRDQEAHTLCERMAIDLPQLIDLAEKEARGELADPGAAGGKSQRKV